MFVYQTTRDITYQVLSDKEKHFKNYHRQKSFWLRKQLTSCVCSFAILSCCAFISAFVANDSSFLFKSEFFTR